MLLIDIEGIDGSGKSTAVKYLADQLRAHGLRVVTTSGAGDPMVPPTMALKAIALDNKTPISDFAREYIFATINQEINNYKRSLEGLADVVISDRGFYSHAAYGRAIMGDSFPVGAFMVNRLHPDTIILLNVDVSVSRARQKQRGLATDVVEAKDDQFHEEVAKDFVDLISSTSYNRDPDTGTYIINANGSQEWVQYNLRLIARQLIEKHKPTN